MRIGNQSGFTGEPKIGDFFGGGLAALGDLNGDGVGDLAVGASGASTIWILFLNADGTLQSFNRFSVSTALSWFGRRLAAIGDLDGDGRTELATHDTSGLFVLFLNRDGSLRNLTRILFSDALFVPPIQPMHMDSATDKIRLGGLCGIGDLDHDGVGDVAVGAAGDTDGSTNFWEVGAVWVLRLNADGTLKATQTISALHGGFTGTLGVDRFGHALTLLGDLDSDGNPELGVGSLTGRQMMDQPFWVLSLAPDGTVTRQAPHGSDDYRPVRIRCLTFSPLSEDLSCSCVSCSPVVCCSPLRTPPWPRSGRSCAPTGSGRPRAGSPGRWERGTVSAPTSPSSET